MFMHAHGLGEAADMHGAVCLLADVLEDLIGDVDLVFLGNRQGPFEAEKFVSARAGRPSYGKFVDPSH
jgi:hypothetical protein